MTDFDAEVRWMEAHWERRPQHDHRTISDAGDCPECRAWTIEFMRDGVYGFALPQYRHHDAVAGARVCHCCNEPITYDPERPDALAPLIRSWNPDRSDAVTTAWATGCNAGAGIGIKGPLPPEVLDGVGLPFFELLDGPEAVAGYQMILALEASR